MPYEVTVTYSETLLGKITTQYMHRKLGWIFYLALPIETIILIFLLAKGSMGWLVGMIGSLLVFNVIYIIMFYVVNKNLNNLFLRRIPSRKVKFIFDDDGFTVEYENGYGTVKWDLIIEIRQLKEAWLLIQSLSIYSIFTIDNVDENIKEFIMQKVKEAGGKVYLNRLIHHG